MASYQQPLAADVIRQHSLRPSMMGYDFDDEGPEFETEVQERIDDAEAAMVANVTEAIADSSSLTTRQAATLALAVRLRTVAAVEWTLAGLKAAGEQDPLLVEESRELRDSAQARIAEAEKLELAIREAAGVPGEQANFDTGTFSVSTYDADAVPDPAEEWVI